MLNYFFIGPQVDKIDVKNPNVLKSVQNCHAVDNETWLKLNRKYAKHSNFKENTEMIRINVKKLLL